jgi:hypothetical protein
MMAGAVHHCVRCQNRAVVVRRDQDGLAVHRRKCERTWSVPNGRLPEEIALHSYGALLPVALFTTHVAA